MKRRKPKVSAIPTPRLLGSCEYVGWTFTKVLLSFIFTAEAEKQAKEKEKSGEKEDYKGDSKFASHLKTSAGVSNFARTRTLKEQREYLPAFACREELMKIIRDNQGEYLLNERHATNFTDSFQSSSLLVKPGRGKLHN